MPNACCDTSAAPTAATAPRWRPARTSRPASPLQPAEGDARANLVGRRSCAGGASRRPARSARSRRRRPAGAARRRRRCARARPCRRRPRRAARSSRSVTRCCSVKSGVLLTRLMTLTMRSTLSRSPTAACSVPEQVDARRRARASLPVAVSMSRPSWPTQALPSRLAMWPERKTEVAACARTARRRAAGMASGGSSMPRLGEAVVDRGHRIVSAVVRDGTANPTLHRCERPDTGWPAGRRWRWRGSAASRLQLQRARAVACVVLSSVVAAVSRVSPRCRRLRRWRRALASPCRCCARAALRLPASSLAGGAVAAPGRRAAVRARRPATSSSPASSPALPQRGPSGPALSLRGRVGVAARRSRCSVPTAHRRSAGTPASTRMPRSAQPQRELRRRPALALHACACASRTATSTRTASTTSCSCSSRACARPATVRDGAGAAAARRARRPSGRAAAPARARRDRRARCRSRARPACWRRWRSATRARSSASDWDLFRNTGVAHLMSISGLHVTMFAWLAGLAIGALWRRSARAMLLAAGAAGGALGRTRRGGRLCARSPAGACRRSAPCWMLADRRRCCTASGVRWPWPLVLLRRGRGRHRARSRGRCCSRASGCRSWRSGC